MGIFDKFFGSSENEGAKPKKRVLPWNQLQSKEELNHIEEKSKTRTQVIFKHSTRCGISKMALNNFERNYNLEEDQIDLYYLDLLNHRDISEEIAAKFQVWHESPQLLVIRNGETVFHSSHGSIDSQSLQRYI